MRKNLIRAWIESGGAPLEDLAAVLNMHFITLIRVFDGGMSPDDSLKQRLSFIFNKPVSELFPEEEA